MENNLDRIFDFKLKEEVHDPTKHSIATGDDGVLDDLFSFAVYNYLKNHWRAATAPAAIQAGMIWSDSDDDKLYHHGAADEEILQLTRSKDVSPQFATARLMDTGADHYLDIKCNENLSAHRLLNIVVGNVARTITLSGNPTLADWFDQAVKVASTPTFGLTTLGGATINGKFTLGVPTELTISAGGAITVTRSYHRVDTNGDIAGDNLDTINGGVDAMVLVLRAENEARSVTVRDGQDNIELEGGVDFNLNSRLLKIFLFYDSVMSKWVEINRFSG